MLHFDSDYMEGAHPAILERLATTNFDQTPGYGEDSVCERARARVRFACEAPDAAVYFLVGGTQVNVAALDQLLRPWEGVVAANTGHINGHEAGALEAHGRKILPLAHRNGKLAAEDVHAYCAAWRDDEARDHVVQPGVVYVSQPTEYGTLYSLEELQALRAVCDEFGMRLFVDGARLGYALAAEGATMTLPDLARLADAFYIGGTKVGAMFGEALVFPDPQLADHFFPLIKKHGALLAKGRMLGLQFDVLFEADGAQSDAADCVPVDQSRYLANGRRAVRLAQKLAAGFRAAGYELAMESPTNQQFVAMDDATVDRLRQHATFEKWERRADGKLVMRFVTSWATREEAIDELLALL